MVNGVDIELEFEVTLGYQRWERWRDTAAPVAYGVLRREEAGVLAARYQQRLMDDGLSAPGVDRAVEWAGGAGWTPGCAVPTQSPCAFRVPSLRDTSCTPFPLQTCAGQLDEWYERWVRPPKDLGSNPTNTSEIAHHRGDRAGLGGQPSGQRSDM